MIKVIVFGSFDPLHEGHKNLFMQAKALGDYLVVVVASDEKIRLRKNREPRVHEQSRLEQIRADQNVDEVCVSDKNDNYTILTKIKPDLIALGYDQVVPDSVMLSLDKYQIVRLLPYKPEVFKSSLIIKKQFY